MSWWWQMEISMNMVVFGSLSHWLASSRMTGLFCFVFIGFFNDTDMEAVLTRMHNALLESSVHIYTCVTLSYQIEISPSSPLSAPMAACCLLLPLKLLLLLHTLSKNYQNCSVLCLVDIFLGATPPETLLFSIFITRLVITITGLAKISFALICEK